MTLSRHYSNSRLEKEVYSGEKKSVFFFWWNQRETSCWYLTAPVSISTMSQVSTHTGRASGHRILGEPRALCPQRTGTSLRGVCECCMSVCVCARVYVQGLSSVAAPPSRPSSCWNLGPDEDVRHVWHAVFQLRDPLLLDVVVRRGVDDREADQKHVRVGVGERPQLVVVLLWGEQTGGGAAWWVGGLTCSREPRGARGSRAGDPGPSLARSLVALDVRKSWNFLLCPEIKYCPLFLRHVVKFSRLFYLRI